MKALLKSIQLNKLTPWFLFSVSLLGIAVNLFAWIINLTGQTTLFEWVEALGWRTSLPLVFSSLAALIITRQPENRVGWLMMIVGLSSINPIPPLTNSLSNPPPQLTPSLFLLLWFEGWSWIPLIFPIFLIPLHFPNGRPPSRRWNWVNRLAIGMWLFFIFLIPFLDEIASLSGEWTLPNPIGFLPMDLFNGPLGALWGLGLVTMGSASVLSLFVRYRSASTVERQQIKWLLFAGGIFVSFYAGTYFFTNTSDTNGWENLLFVLSVLTLPTAIAISILRYRLYDIDLIIRRTLQYVLLSGLLSLVYFGGVALLQAMVGGQSSPLIIVLTTLTIAALFNPLRRRVQDFIDRRFYRQRYDTEKALAEFAAAARSETDLAQLSFHLTTVVQETLQPAEVNLWLMPYRQAKGDTG